MRHKTFWVHDGAGEHVAGYCEYCRQQFPLNELRDGVCERCEMDGPPDHRDVALDSQGFSF